MQLPDKKTALPLQGKWASVRSIHDTQQLYIRNEISQMHGLTAILMKRRNGGQWTEEDRAILQRNLRALSNLSPYMIPLIMPGGVLMLPLLAWWLDCRRKARKDKAESV
ncbi:MAG: hypothetical protein A2Z65_01520 [Gallionellales bacterium RIFCSPLOWO2_02_58_13]|nr:MAG: hypothetical protein A2Z65_01520 [Gallionellales bacterium RIFCSPLOWO2_02_58_13]